MDYRRIPIRGWQRCVYEAAAFDNEFEFKAAVLLDADTRIRWWLRNDPPQFKVLTPAGGFEPDFVYLIRRGRELRYGVLEVKGRIFWNGPESEPRIKARAFREWCNRVAESKHPEKWEFTIVWSEDVSEADSLDQLRGTAQESFSP